jgi:hypothetical protein
MATILDLFKEQNKDLYGLAGKVIIESKGVINPGRAAALAVSSPNAAIGMIGNQVAGLIKGSANRPSDTIFKSDKKFEKPISLTSAGNILRQSNDNVNPDIDYFVKTSPDGFQNLNLKGIIDSPVSSVVNLAKDTLRNPVATKTAFNSLRDALKKKKLTDEGGYGTKYQITDFGGKPLSATKTFSTHAPVYKKLNGNSDYIQVGLEERPKQNQNWDIVNNAILNYESGSKATAFDNAVKEMNIPYVKLKIYDSAEQMILPGTISGLSEDFAPEWNGFKYVGSPFNIYRYGGVERSIKFDLKLYYTDLNTKNIMIKNIDKIRKLTYPNEDLVAIAYNNNAGYSPLVFKPNLVYLSINGLYDNLLGIIESISISIDDNITWPSMDENMSKMKNELHPSVVNVSFGFKVLENPKIEKQNGKQKLVYDFRGNKES